MSNIHVRSIRTVAHDHNHNAMTGARWFQGKLYVAYRQGIAHVCQEGRLMVKRSRDEGITFDPVAVIRGEFDTRDAHVYHVDDKRLFVAGFEEDSISKPMKIYSGCAYSDDGNRWTPWLRYTGTDGYVMWRPEYHRGKFYCVGYDYARSDFSSIAWFESSNGIDWKKQQVIHEGTDQPNEVFPEFQSDGSLIALCRREGKNRRPLLLRSKPPYTQWDKTELDVPIAGPCLWTVDGEIFISGRWFLSPRAAHTAIFRVVENKVEMIAVLPSGPDFDHSYMGVARWPNNRHRFALSYYANHHSVSDSRVTQSDHPGVYVVDACFDAKFITSWRRSNLQSNPGLNALPCPDGNDASLGWTPISAAGKDKAWEGMVAEHEFIANREGVLFFDTMLDVGPCDGGAIQLGYDGPIKVWVNGVEMFCGPGQNPAVPDTTSVAVKTHHGVNRVVIALDTNHGKAWGFYCRFEPKA